MDICVSVIIVNFNTSQYLKRCINSIYKYTKDISFEIIVSDNSSTDDSILMLKNNFPNVIIIENKTNLGFGAANNKAKKISKGKYIFYLNSDTELLNNAIKIFYDYWETNHNKKSLGVLGANLLQPDKISIADSYGYFFTFYQTFKIYLKETIKLWFNIHSKTVNNPNYKFKTGKVDIVIGADMFLLNDSFAEFDDYFFLYHEESDLQLNLNKNNKYSYLIPGPKIIHYSGASDILINKSKYNNYVSFSKIQDKISKIKYFNKNSKYKFQKNILKIVILIQWIYPPIIKYTKKYFKELLKI